MKKTFLLILLAVVLCYSSSTPALASENNTDDDKTEPVFNTSDFDGLSHVELVKAKLLADGHSQALIDTIPVATLEKIALTSDGYIIEALTDSEDESLKPEVFDPKSITVLDENGNVIFAPAWYDCPISMFSGQNAYGFFCYPLRGGCYFEGILAHQRIVPTPFTYLQDWRTIRGRVER